MKKYITAKKNGNFRITLTNEGRYYEGKIHATMGQDLKEIVVVIRSSSDKYYDDDSDVFIGRIIVDGQDYDCASLSDKLNIDLDVQDLLTEFKHELVHIKEAHKQRKKEDALRKFIHHPLHSQLTPYLEKKGWSVEIYNVAEGTWDESKKPWLKISKKGINISITPLQYYRNDDAYMVKSDDSIVRRKILKSMIGGVCNIPKFKRAVRFVNDAVQALIERKRTMLIAKENYLRNMTEIVHKADNNLAIEVREINYPKGQTELYYQVYNNKGDCVVNKFTVRNNNLCNNNLFRVSGLREMDEIKFVQFLKSII
jgi:hypothetical protein